MKDIYFFKRLIQGIFLLEDENVKRNKKKLEQKQEERGRFMEKDSPRNGKKRGVTGRASG